MPRCVRYIQKLLTRPLRRPLRRLLLQDDAGAIGILVAALLGGGLLLGLGAMVIDVGQLYQERAELQNGADAAALAVAKLCIESTCTSTNALSTAQTYAGENTKDGVAGVDTVCGTGLSTCPTSTGVMTDCPAAPSSGAGYVDVHTSTKTTGGGTLLGPTFGQALLGNGSYTGTKVLACSQAAWGAPSSGNTLAFTISACSWDSWTSSGANFAPAPPAVPAASYDHQLNLANMNNDRGCTNEPTGSDGAGAFGWAIDQTGSCGINTNTITFPADTGASAGSTCQTALSNAYTSRAAILLPVYTTATGTGSNTKFTLKGFAAFVVTGYQIPSGSRSDWLNSANSACSFKCIEGYFTHALVTGAGAGSGNGTNLGAVVIGLSG